MNIEKEILRIKTLRIQGATNVAISGLRILKQVAEEDGFGKKFEKTAEKLIKVRPTAVPLYNAVEIVKKEKSIEKTDELINYFKSVNEKIAKAGGKLIKDNQTILTHCHSSETIEILKKARIHGKTFKVIVTETRPKLQGIETAKELLKNNIEIVYTTDNAADFFAKEIDIFMVGIDSIRKEGIYNKIGTYQMALAAKDSRKKVYFAGNLMKVDERKEIFIEMRPPEEIINPAKLKGAEIKNPAFDCTPWRLIDGVVTEKGIFKKWPELKRLV